MRLLIAWTLLTLLAAGPYPASAQSADGYRLLGNSIHVDRASHWRDWIYQNDMVSSLNVPIVTSRLFDIDSEGLKPVFFRRKINAAANATQFSYTDVVRAGGAITTGGATALSNDRLVSRVIDNDLSTYWEPDTPSSYQDRLRDGRDFTVEGLRDWEILVDLGRLVFADSITVVMPSGQVGADGEISGDPVKSFRLFGSMGERFPFPQGTNLKFTLLGRATATQQAPLSAAGELPFSEESKFQRITFLLQPFDRADWDGDGQADISGAFIQYVQLTITDTDLWRDASIGAGEEALEIYQALPSERRGALVYQRQTAGGFLVELEDEAEETAAEKYEALPENKRGPILYFRKEVPRISEIQVWARGDNFALRPHERAGASYENGGLGTPGKGVDGLYDTEWFANTWAPTLLKGTAWFDLGAVFWVDNLYFVMKRFSGDNDGAFRGHEFLVSDGTLLKPVRIEQPDDFPQLEDGLKWENIISEAHIDNNDSQVRVWNESFPLRKLRFLQLRNIDITKIKSGIYGSLGTLGDMQAYGVGYPVSVWAYSPPIKLQDNRGNFIRKTMPRIAWQGEAVVRQTDPVSGGEVEVAEPLALHPEVRLQIQTRTSDQTDTDWTYFEVVDIQGAEERQEISEQAYDELVYRWDVWNTWASLSTPHVSRADDDGDGAVDEDPIDFIDNDGDGLIDEDGKKLGKGRLPKSTPDRDGELALVGWSEWSASYQPTSGRNEAVVISPNPRKFLQIRVNISSRDPFKTARLGFLRVDLAPPLALELAGELALLSEPGLARPVEDLKVEPLDYLLPHNVDPLQPQVFSYFIRAAGPDPQDSDVGEGFDELLIVTPQPSSLRGVRLGQVRVGSRSSILDSEIRLTTALETSFAHSFARDGEQESFRDVDGAVLKLVATGPDSLYLRLPFSANRELPVGSHAIIEVQFASQAFREGAEFTSFIRDSQNPESVFQRVDTDLQDATELVASSTAQVSLMAVSGNLITDVKLPRVFTPNGDQINEALLVRFTLLKMLEERPLEVNFYNLAGRLVGRAESQDGASGSGTTGVLEFSWDGRGLNGRLVPPGIYLCRIRVEADQGDDEFVRAVHVVY